MSWAVRAIRGATCVDRDDPAHIEERVQELLVQLMERNGLESDHFISIIFTATPDIASRFPASAARTMGLEAVPLLGAQELDVEGALARCIRVMAHVNTERSRSDIEHVFLHEARQLRVDLVR